ncbi:helix-turn-helix domain-containing protein [Bacillus toyonensis]|nr:helix-turn-helix domain-containing protein [Bacillus toyonensis]
MGCSRFVFNHFLVL